RRSCPTQGTAQNQGDRHLDAVVRHAARFGKRVWCGRAVSGLVRPPLEGARTPRLGRRSRPTHILGPLAGARRGPLRNNGRKTSTAAVIEAARLAESLAALRDLALPGLDEMREASLATLCQGEIAPWRIIDQARHWWRCR